MDIKPESSGFEIFPWNRNFETGLEEIDKQHRVLVDILNRLAEHFAIEGAELNCSVILDELLAYTAFHFECEETIWNNALGDCDMARNHHDCHQMFFAQIQEHRQSQAPREQILEELLTFLTRWLAFHILESDRRMAHTVKALERGVPLEQARHEVDSELSGSISVLVNAFLEIYGKLSETTVQLIREKNARFRAEDELVRIRNG